MTITSDSVTVTGLRFVNVGVAFTEDLAAIKVVRASDCVIKDNEIDNAFFGIYLQEASNCVLEGNVLHATRLRDATSGNGIHLWHSREITIVGNHVSGHRDGIYFEFTREAHVRDNVSTDNLRYGLHFMYSDSCDYERNTFRHNGAGVAVMYSHRVRDGGEPLRGKSRLFGVRAPAQGDRRQSSRTKRVREQYDGALRRRRDAAARGSQSVREQRLGAQASVEHGRRDLHQRTTLRGTPSMSRRTAGRARPRSRATTGRRTTGTISITMESATCRTGPCASRRSWWRRTSPR